VALALFGIGASRPACRRDADGGRDDGLLCQHLRHPGTGTAESGADIDPAQGGSRPAARARRRRRPAAYGSHRSGHTRRPPAHAARRYGQHQQAESPRHRRPGRADEDRREDQSLQRLAGSSGGNGRYRAGAKLVASVLYRARHDRPACPAADADHGGIGRHHCRRPRLCHARRDRPPDACRLFHPAADGRGDRLRDLHGLAGRTDRPDLRGRGQPAEPLSHRAGGGGVRHDGGAGHRRHRALGHAAFPAHRRHGRGRHGPQP
jgi:hypothetical protein